MAKTKISEFSATPGNNTDINGINIAEGCAPSGINNAIRQLMAELKDFQTGSAGDDLTVGGALSVTGATTVGGNATINGNVTMGDASTDTLTINGTAVSIPNGLNIDSNTLVIDATNNRIGVGQTTPLVVLHITATDAVKLPVGTTAQRPTGAIGYVRYNSDLSRFEGYRDTGWIEFSSGATGAGGDQVFFENSQTVTTSYTLTSGKNAMSAGNITLASGVTVTVPAGARWAIV